MGKISADKSITYEATEAELKLLAAGYHLKFSETVVFRGDQAVRYVYGQSEDVETYIRDGKVHVSWTVDEPKYIRTVQFDPLQGAVGFWYARPVLWLPWIELDAVVCRARELGISL